MSSASMLLLSNAIFFMFSALAMIASVAIFFLARATESQKNRELEMYKVQAAAEMSRARVEVEQARADAATISADAARAHQSAAALELQLHREKAVVEQKTEAAGHHVKPPHRRPMPRVISRPVNIPLSVGMADTGISIVSETDDAESDALAGAIRRLFDGGAPVSMGHDDGRGRVSRGEIRGVHIVRSADPEAQRISKTLFELLSRNKIECRLIDAGGNGDPRSASGQPGAKSVVAVYVGHDPGE